MRALLTAAIIASVLVLCACPTSKSSRCIEVCQQEAECAEELENSNSGALMDENECTSSCTALERDTQGHEIVSKHIECVRTARTCQQVIDCP